MSSCPLCGSASTHQFDSEYVSVAKCQSAACGHLFAEDAPSMAGVQHKDEPDHHAAQFGARNAKLIQYLEGQQVVGPGLNLLDFGSGVGHLASAIASTYPSGQVTCIEADPPAVARLRELGLNVVESLTDVPDQSVDSILMVEVIEHLDDPMAVLAILRSKLRPDGRLFVTTPVGETRRGSTDTIAYLTPEHVQFFNERSLARALAESGFSRHRFLTVNAMYPPGVGLQQRIKVGVKRVARPIWSRLFGHRHLVVKASP